MKRLSLITVLLLSGCGNIATFQTMDGSPAKVTDQQLCQLDAEKAVGGQDNPFIARSVAIRIYDDCMVTKGYQMVKN